MAIEEKAGGLACLFPSGSRARQWLTRTEPTCLQLVRSQLTGNARGNGRGSARRSCRRRRDTALRALLQPIPADSCYQTHFHVHPLIATKYSSAVFRGYLRRHICQSEKRVAPSVLIETGRNLSSRLVGRERGAMSLIQSAIAATRTNVIGGRTASLSHCLAV